MKVFLFLYPYKRFFETCIGYPDDDLTKADRVLDHYSQAVDLRYRQNGFRVAWLLFRAEGDLGFDFETLDVRVGIRETDLLVDSGMTFAEHCPCVLGERGIPEKEWPKPVYADLPFVFSQLPQPIEELWVGGHRHSDCVSKVAYHAYHRLGLKGRVHVDEDLTEWGFFHVLQDLHPERYRSEDTPAIELFPLVREVWTYESIGFTRYWGWRTDWAWKRVRRIRNLRPWFVHN